MGGDAGRIALAVGTAGLSEGGGLIPIFEALTPSPEDYQPEIPASQQLAPAEPPPAPKISDTKVQSNAEAQANAYSGTVETPEGATAEQRQKVATGRASTILTSAADDTLGRKSNRRYALGG